MLVRVRQECELSTHWPSKQNAADTRRLRSSCLNSELRRKLNNSSYFTICHSSSYATLLGNHPRCQLSHSAALPLLSVTIRTYIKISSQGFNRVRIKRFLRPNPLSESICMPPRIHQLLFHLAQKRAHLLGRPWIRRTKACKQESGVSAPMSVMAGALVFSLTYPSIPVSCCSRFSLPTSLYIGCFGQGPIGTLYVCSCILMKPAAEIWSFIVSRVSNGFEILFPIL